MIRRPCVRTCARSIAVLLESSQLSEPWRVVGTSIDNRRVDAAIGEGRNR